MLKKSILFLLQSFILSGCIVYRAPIHQGNIITQSMQAQLKLGMTQGQVHHIMGTSMLSSISMPDLWEYIDYYDLGYQKPTQKKLVLSFEKGKLTQIQRL